MVKGFDRLTRTGIAIVFVGIFVVVGIGIAFTQSPEIANPFVETFNFNTVEEVFPLLTSTQLRLDPRLGNVIEGSAGTPPSGQFITCVNSIDGEFCSAILQSVNLFCKLKQAVVYQFIDGTSRTVSSSDFDNFALLFPEFALTDPAKIGEQQLRNLDVQVRMACDVPLLTDGTRLPFFVTAENGRLAIKVDAYDEFGNLQPVLTTRAVTVPRADFTDSGLQSPIDASPLFIGNERILGSVSVLASEIENDLNPSRDFNTRVVIDLSGKLFIEIPDLNSLTNAFVVEHDVGGRAGFENPITLQLDLFVDTPESAPTVFKTTVSTVQPDKLVVNGNALTISKVNIFYTMTSYSDSEGTPDCELRKKQVGFFASSLLQTVKGLKVSTVGENTQFSCQFPIKGDIETGTYEVKITTPNPTTSGNSRPSTTTTFIVTLATTEDPTGTPVPCPTVSVLRDQITALDDATLLQQKADLLDKQKRGTLTLCDGIKLPLVIAEVASRGLTSAPTPTPTPTPTNGADTICTPPQIRTKIGANTFTCVNPAGTGGGLFGGLLPKFIACAPNVIADTSAGEICLSPSVFAIYNFVINNLLIVGIGLVVFLIVVKVIMVAISKKKGGIVLKD